MQSVGAVIRRSTEVYIGSCSKGPGQIGRGSALYILRQEIPKRAAWTPGTLSYWEKDLYVIERRQMRLVAMALRLPSIRMSFPTQHTTVING